MDERNVPPSCVCINQVFYLRLKPQYTDWGLSDLSHLLPHMLIDFTFPTLHINPDLKGLENYRYSFRHRMVFSPIQPPGRLC
jgi:hypothetical protein